MGVTLLSQANLSVRAINCLHAADIRTVEDLKKFAAENPLSDLIKFRNFGSKSFKEVSEFLTNIEIDEIEKIPLIVSMIKNMDCLKDDVDISSYSLGLSHMYDRLKK